MKETETMSTIVHYLARNHAALAGAMPKQDYFLLEGREKNPGRYAKSKIVYTTVPDALAQAIEDKQFFGYGVPNLPVHATHPQNVRLLPIVDGGRIDESLVLAVERADGDLRIKRETIAQKSYLDLIRTSEGFVRAAHALSIDGDLEQIAATLYND